MSQNTYKPLPIDKNGNEFQLSPPNFVALKQYTSENGTVSSVITVTDNTTILEVATGGVSAVVKFIASGDTTASVIGIAGSTANYDVAIPANTVRKLAIPQETQGVSSIVGLNKQAGLYNRFAWKTNGIGSIMGVEY